jgi:DME family drug/metabolite transporter
MRRLDRVPGVVLVSVAATMWGLDALIRKPLTGSTAATTIVFGEHVLLVFLTIPLLVPALRALRRAGLPYVAAGVAIGAGASAIATILLTQAIITSHFDLVTIYVLQKSQPLVAVIGAWIVLGEQPRRGFAWFFLAALAGIWLAALPHPLDPHARGLVPIAETLGAAVLWGLGTVFGRFLTRKLTFEHVTTVRFAFGLAASACALPIMGVQAYAGVRNSFGSPCSLSSPVWSRSASTTTGYSGLPRSWPRSASLRSR